MFAAIYSFALLCGAAISADSGERERPVAVAPAAAVQGAGQAARDEREGDKRPRINVRAQPQVAIAPARIVLTAELVGGADDYEEFYCPTIEWDWGDDTRSESTSDCAPFEPGKSSIRRRFTVEHVYRRAGAYKIFFRLKKRDRTAAAGSATVQVRPGGPEF